jgi:formylglycine-generating enzyme required for sulfatase activity
LRYGTRLPEHGGKSVTELEFEEAVRLGRPVHAYFIRYCDDEAGIDFDPEAKAALEAFRNRVTDRCTGGVAVECRPQPDGRSGQQVFEEEITALATKPPPRPGSSAPSGAPARRTYSLAELDTWVAAHQERLAKAFAGLDSVQARQVHVPLEVCLQPAGAANQQGPRLLQPADLAPLLSAGADHVLLLSGDGGAGKTSLAFAIARWLLAGEPDGVVRLPLLIETALAPAETVADRAGRWLAAQAQGSTSPPEPDLVRALLATKRLVPIVDHLSELAPAARAQLLAALPPGLVIVTSRSLDDGFRERPLSRITPQRIAAQRLQEFFLDYLRRKGEAGSLSDDDLNPAQAQLKRIVGDKPITVLLAQMFIDDVIAHREEGLLAGSVPELMLSYVRRLDTPDDPALRQRAGIEISHGLVQRALRAVALASHRQASPAGQPLFQPLEFSGEGLALPALAAPAPVGLGLSVEQAREVLGYLIALRLLQKPGEREGQLRFPLDPLADHLAAAEQFERLELEALQQGPGVWEAFLAALEPRPVAERDRMRGFLLALRDCAQEAQERRALAMPAAVPDRLAELGLLDPEGERYRLALQRARKWMWELGVPVASERRDGIAKLAAMAAATDDAERRAARDVAGRRLARLLVEVVPEIQAQRRLEQADSALVLALIGQAEPLQQLAANAEQPVALRRAALEALGLAALRSPDAAIAAVLEQHLRADALDLLVTGEEGWEEHDRRLPLLQGASRGLQLAASADLPLLGSGPGRMVPMLTLTALTEGEDLRIRTEVVAPPVWKLPLPGGEQLEIVVIEGGDYPIGSPREEDGRDWYARQRDRCVDPESGEPLDVEAQRTVRLEPYGMVRHLISQAQWQAVAALPPVEGELRQTPWSFKQPIGLWEQYAQPFILPVDSVSWNDCQEWLRRLNRWLQQEWAGLAGGGDPPQLALPGEGHWEAACRAGASTPFHFGEVLDASWANYYGESSYGRGRVGVDRSRPLPIGALGLVNRWGLAEMHGQLFEWCGDQWHRDPKGDGWPADGQAWEGPDGGLEGSAQQAWRLLRGGSWFYEPLSCRAAARYGSYPAYVYAFIGVRPCCLLPPGSLLGS